MIGKHYSIGDTFEATGEPLVKIANFEKLAEDDNQDIKGFISTFKPESKYLYLHVIAMSSGEHYGCNVNGDYFPEADLIARHKTFETQAKVFKEHDNKPYSQSYGYVPFAWYNMKMHRVELILAIDKVAGKEFVDRVERGERLAVSMGTRVKYDVCSICGNHASKPHEYCEHIRLHKKEIFPDGRQAYMINPNPTFFDISIVRRPADKTAYQLAKVASTEYKCSSYNSFLFDEFDNLDSYFPVERNYEIWEIPDDDELLSTSYKTASIKNTINLTKSATMDKQVPAIAVRAVNKDIHDFLPAMAELDKDIPDPLLENLAHNYSIPDILRSFLGTAVPLKPKEFTKIIIIKHNLPKEAFDPVLEGVLKAKPADKIYGIIRPKIKDLISGFIKSRSSFLPSIVGKLKLILGDKGLVKQAASWYTPNPVMEMLDQNPKMNFGYVRRLPSWQDLNGGLPEDVVFVNNNGIFGGLAPSALSREAAMREQVAPRLSNVDRNQLIALGAMAGSNYQAYRNPQVILNAINEPDLISSLALTLATIKGIFGGNKNNSSTTVGIPKPLATQIYPNNPVEPVPPIKLSSDESADPLESLVIEHLVNAYNPNAEMVMDSIKLGSEIIDGTSLLTKTASKKSIKNEILDVLPYFLFPAYITRRSASPINTMAGIVLDNKVISSAADLFT